MGNFVLVTEFDGTDFNGTQSQSEGRTVQDVLENALYEVTGKKVRVLASSRLDAGVHARCFTVNFEMETSIPGDKFLFPLNNVLPEDIKVVSSYETDPEFNSRRDAKGKTYIYRFREGSFELPLNSRYVLTVKGEHDRKIMEKAASLFIGEHDFKAFMSTGSDVSSTVRTIYDMKLKEKDGIFELEVTGNGFLYNMVRIITGTIIDVGAGRRSLKDIEEAFRTGNRDLAGKVVPAKGLTLNKVFYDDSLKSL